MTEQERVDQAGSRRAHEERHGFEVLASGEREPVFDGDLIQRISEILRAPIWSVSASDHDRITTWQLSVGSLALSLTAYDPVVYAPIVGQAAVRVSRPLDQARPGAPEVFGDLLGVTRVECEPEDADYVRFVQEDEWHVASLLVTAEGALMTGSVMKPRLTEALDRADDRRHP